MTEVSVIVPAHNAGSEFWENMQHLLAYLEDTFSSFELIIAEDGSADNTGLYADMLADRHHAVRAVHAEDALGKGGGITSGFDGAVGDILAFIDADLAPSLSALPSVINPVRYRDYDVAVGSRYLSEAQSNRPEERQFLSYGYNMLVRQLFDSEIVDHQCGCKAIRRSAYDAVRPSLRSHDFFWDTELLIQLQQQGFQVKEVPISWEPQSESSIDVFRDPPRMLLQLLLLRYRLSF